MIRSLDGRRGDQRFHRPYKLEKKQKCTRDEERDGARLSLSFLVSKGREDDEERRSTEEEDGKRRRSSRRVRATTRDQSDTKSTDVRSSAQTRARSRCPATCL